MATELEELIDFLSSPSPPVKKAAVDIVQGLTGSEDGLQALGSYSDTVLPPLSRLLGEKKAYLLDGRASGGASVDSARQNLAATFVNAFVNAGFGQDKLMKIPSETSSAESPGHWLFKNKEHEKASACASLGMIMLWDVDNGLTQIGIGLLEDYTDKEESIVSIGIFNKRYWWPGQ